MKNLKTWIALLLVAVFAMSFTACGSNGADNNKAVSYTHLTLPTT